MSTLGGLLSSTLSGYRTREAPEYNPTLNVVLILPLNLWLQNPSAWCQLETPPVECKSVKIWWLSRISHPSHLLQGYTETQNLSFVSSSVSASLFCMIQTIKDKQLPPDHRSFSGCRLDFEKTVGRCRQGRCSMFVWFLYGDTTQPSYNRKKKMVSFDTEI